MKRGWHNKEITLSGGGTFLLVALLQFLCFLLLYHYFRYKLPLGEFLPGLLLAIRDLAVFTFFILCVYLVGARTSKRLIPAGTGVGEEIVLSLGIGFTFYSLLGLIVSLLHILSIPVLWVSLVLPAVFCRQEGAVLLGRLSEIRATFTRDGKIGPSHLLLLLVFSLYGIAALSPPCWIDPVTYHLVIPKEYLLNGGVPAQTTTTFNYYPPGMSMLYLYLMGIGSDFLPKLLNGFFFILISITLYNNAKTFTSATVARYAVLLYACQWVVQHGIQRANVDFFYSFFSVLSFFLVLRIILQRPEKPARTRIMVLAGLFMGTAVYGKYTAISPVMALEAVLGFLLFRRKLAVRDFIVLNACAAAVFVPCMVRNYIYTGDPLFWFLTDFLGSGRVVNAEQLQAMGKLHHLIHPRTTWTMILLGPFFTYIYGRYPTTNFDGFIDPFYLLSGIVAVFFMRKHAVLRAMLFYLFVFYLVWFVTAAVTRYLLPALPVLSLLTVLTFTLLAEQVGAKWQRHFRRLPHVLIAGFCIVSTLSFMVEARYFLSNNIPVFLRILDREKFLRNTAVGPTRAVARFINEQEAETDLASVPTDKKKIFMIFANQTYYLDRPAYSDTLHANIALLRSIQRKGQDPVRWLKDQGYRYLLFDVGRILWYNNEQKEHPALNPYPEDLAYLREYVVYFQKEILSRVIEKRRFGGLILYDIP